MHTLYIPLYTPLYTLYTPHVHAVRTLTDELTSGTCTPRAQGSDTNVNHIVHSER